MTPILLLGLLAWLSAVCHWLGERWRVPVAPLLLLLGTALRPWLAVNWSWQEVFPLLGVTVCLSFFEGGLRMGSRKLELAGLSKRLVAICPKLGWVVMTGLAGLVLGLPSPVCLLLGAVVMVFSPKGVAALVARQRGGEAEEQLLFQECYLVSCVGGAWAALMVLVIHTHLSHPAVVQTLLSTTRLFLFGGLIGYLGARLLAALHSHLSPASREPACLGWVLLCYGAAHSVLPGAGLVASIVLGKTLSQRQVELPVAFYSSLQAVLVGILGILMGTLIPAAELVSQPFRYPAFALLVVALRPLLVLAATFRMPVSPTRRANLWAVAPRGIVTLGVAATAADLLSPEAIPEMAHLPAIVYWVVMATNLLPLLPIGPRLPSEK